MHNPLRILLTAGAFALGVLSLQAQPAVKLYTVDLARVFDSHYETRDNSAKFQEAAQRAQDRLNEMATQIQGLGKEYQELLEQTKNTVLTPEAREKAAQDAEKKMQELQQRNQEAQSFRVSNQRALEARARNFRAMIMEDIAKKISELAKAKNATLVLDKSSIGTALGVPVAVYSDASYDITEEVIAEINKGHPVPAAAPAAPAAPAAATTPAAPAAPASSSQFVVPNVTSDKK